ncbi:hypothetical protein LCI18_006875 [Fusarium solani-melongenae]|uniref:Uncharacterized protein n=1 Tax=Fusarium solani subsp. cucurbitae TaxID=2747967 RepID=A0ACD3Z409_FUSSC|nr:hypothetical protein LCI18_006875 [Fusarium solani-melongenae]
MLIEKPSRVKGIVSTRDSLDIEGLNHMRPVNLHLGSRRNEVASVVSSYIDHKVSNLASEKNVDQKTSLMLRQLLLPEPQPSLLCIHLSLQDLGRIQSDQMAKPLSSLPTSLGPLYLELIKGILNSPYSSLCQRILAIATAVVRPVTLEELKNLGPELQDVNEGLLEELISFYGSFLALWERTIYFVHQSARQFLLDNASHPEVRLELTDQHYRIFTTSIKALSEVLCENIYDLTDLRVPVDEISRPNPDPLGAVRYSCVNWVEHLTYSTSATALHEDLRDGGMVHTFLKMHLLHWFEAFGLLRVVSQGREALRKLLEFTVSRFAQPLFLRRTSDLNTDRHEAGT